ncbi:hypothetical protein [Salinispora arenicola]|uniref:hypothetical protein n=1 Tax=Salinispora arenicola TaxID=168697 RepID=UPI0027DD5E2C|nr:hypothetical protein [Salinispora arenicola]
MTGDVLHLTRAASPQFIRPIFFRLIKIRRELHTYDGWTWLDGYQLNSKGDAVSRRELFVFEAGTRVMHTPPTTQLRPRRTNPTADREVRIDDPTSAAS